MGDHSANLIGRVAHQHRNASIVLQSYFIVQCHCKDVHEQGGGSWAYGLVRKKYKC